MGSERIGSGVGRGSLDDTDCKKKNGGRNLPKRVLTLPLQTGPQPHQKKGEKEEKIKVLDALVHLRLAKFSGIFFILCYLKHRNIREFWPRLTDVLLQRRWEEVLTAIRSASPAF